MKKTRKEFAYQKRGRGTGYKAGRERFSGVEFKALRFLDEVRDACDKWLEAHEDRPANWDSFRYGKNTKK
jgi:hypothetical protein